MEGMDHDHMNGTSSTNGTTETLHVMNMLTHMTFFWGKDAEILFSGWPGTRTGLYVLALIFVFVLSLLVECLSRCQLIKPNLSNNISAGLFQAFVHGIRIGLAYLVMLALMSFNVGVFLIAVAGHTIGFLLFRTRVFKNSEKEPDDDLPK